LSTAAFFLEGLTVVSLIGTGILVGVFAFLFVVERKNNSKPKGDS
jgi:hypothetical protein